MLVDAPIPLVPSFSVVYHQRPLLLVEFPEQVSAAIIRQLLDGMLPALRQRKDAQVEREQPQGGKPAKDEGTQEWSQPRL